MAALSSFLSVNIILLLFSSILLSSAQEDHVCMHDAIVKTNKRASLGFGQSYLGTFPSDDNSQPLRVILDTRYIEAGVDLSYTCETVGQRVAAVDNVNSYLSSYACTTPDLITNSNRDYIQNVLKPASLQLIQAALRTMPVQGKLILGSAPSMCGAQIGAQIPVEYTSQGGGAADADIVIFVTARPVPTSPSSSSKTLAFGVHCLEDQYGRPIAGQLNFNPSGISTNNFDLATQLLTAVHEISHVLGFSITKMQSVNDPLGGTLDLTSNMTIQSGADGSYQRKTVIKSPAVTAWVRDHFKCPTLVGGELEDDGGAGTRLSHWEKRVYMNEFMTGSSTHNPVFSGLTLAFFEDSGWYRANYSAADRLMWGRGQGCKFATGSCANWPSTSPVGYFCNAAAQTSCTYDLQGKGVCGIRTLSTPVPAADQYLGSGTTVGPSDLADQCPYYVAPTSGWCTDPVQNSDSLVSFGETYGPSSRCFISSLVKNVPVSSTTSQRCYPTTCLSETEVRVKVDGQWWSCPSGVSIKINGFGGTLQCPPSEIICAGASTNPFWPRIHDIQPPTGGPGTIITITGSGFMNGSTVTVHDACQDVKVVSSTVIIATIPDTEWFNSPNRVVNEHVDVQVTDPAGRSAINSDGFTINVPFSIKRMSMWVQANILPVLAVIIAIVIAIAVCIYCCFKSRKQEKLREREVQRAHEQEEAYYAREEGRREKRDRHHDRPAPQAQPLQQARSSGSGWDRVRNAR